MPWKTFLKAHWGAIAAADVFSVEVLTRGKLVRYLVRFVIDLKTRRVRVAAGPLSGFGHLIVDRNPLYTAHFRPCSKPRAYNCCAYRRRARTSTPTPRGSFGRSASSVGGTGRRERLGGLLSFYVRNAA
jgi:hypothetical protein